MNKSAFIQGYVHNKEAAPRALQDLERFAAKALGGRTPKAYLSYPGTTEQMGAAVGSALGLSSGLMGNFLLSKILGYKGSLRNYLAAGGTGALAGGALGYGVAKKWRFYNENPEEFNALLSRIESSPRLQKWHEWQKQSPLMKPVRKAMGRVVTNIKGPKGYQMDFFRDTLRKAGPIGVAEAALKDERIWEESKAIKRSDLDTQAREALWRHYWDLPDRPGEPGLKDFFEVVPRTDGKTVRFNPGTVEGKRLQSMAEGDFYNELNPEKTQSRANFMGGVAVKETPYGYDVSDPWDMHTSSRRYKTERGLRPNVKGKTRDLLEIRDTRNHLLRNIFDRLISNPVTVEHTFAKK